VNLLLLGICIGLAIAIVLMLVAGLCRAASHRDDRKFRPEPWVNGGRGG
jgi:hypothetical protein